MMLIEYPKIAIVIELGSIWEKEIEEIKNIIKEDLLNKKTDSTKTEEEKQPDVILEWKDE